jgi:putative transposase
MTYTFIARACTDLPVSVCCRVMKVSTSGFYAWQANPVSDKDLDDAYLTDTIVDIWRMSRRSYGSPRVHAELRLGEDIRCGKKRVERLMTQAGICGIHRRRRRGCTRRDLAAQSSDDLVNRAFNPVEPDQLWVMDVTEHPTGQGKVYVAVVLDAFSRMVIGWSIAEHMPQELVVDALQMAIWRGRPAPGTTIAHSDHGSTYTSWAFGRRLGGAGILGSMGSVGDCFDCRSRELLRDPAARAARRAALGEPPAACPRGLRVDRGLVQPEETPQLLQNAQPGRLRGRSRGMISN